MLPVRQTTAGAFDKTTVMVVVARVSIAGWLAVLAFALAAIPTTVAFAAQESVAAPGDAEAQRQTASDTAPPDVAVQPEEAQPVGPPPGVEVMRVKGRAVSGIETDVPESVTQFDAETIAALGAGTIADLAVVTPNVEIRSAGATTATFFIRGVGLSDFSSNAAGAVAIYQDNVPLNAPAIQNVPLFDTLTVDVKRGPQGGGLFRNASAGAIMIYANKPSGEYEAKLRSSTGSFWSKDARDAFIRDTEGFINLPLIEGSLSSRLAFRVRRTDPFMTNGCGNAPVFEDRRTFNPSVRERAEVDVCGEVKSIETDEISAVPAGLPVKIGDRGDWSARGALRFSPPGADMDWLFNVHGGRLDQDSTLGQVIGTDLTDRDGRRSATFGDVTNSGYVEPDQFEEFQEIKLGLAGVSSEDEWQSQISVDDKNRIRPEARAIAAKRLAERPLDRNPYRGDYNRVGQTTRDTFGTFLRGDFPIAENVDFTTTTAYESYKRFRDTDNDFSPDVVFEFVTSDRARQFSQDVEISGETLEGAVRWIFGAAFLEEKLSNLSFQDVGTVGSNLDDIIKREFTQETTAYMVGVQLSWDFLDDFTLDLAGRFNYEHKSFDISEDLPGDPPESEAFGATWREPTGGVSLRYHINDETTVYAKYTHGFKAGHFNSNNIDDTRDNGGPARPEFIDAFEWGLSGSWIENRVKLRSAFFFYDYRDYQVFIFRDSAVLNEPPALVIRNAQAVQQYGAEIDLTVNPLQAWAPDTIEGLELTVRFGWLASEFLEFTDVVFRSNPVANIFKPSPVTIDFGGSRLINAPEFKVSGTVEWPFDLGEWGTITPRYDFVWSDDVSFDPTEGRGTRDRDGNAILPKHALGQRALWLHSIRLGYRTPVGNVEVSGWVRNILDERYKTFAFDASFFAHEVINFVGDPRSAGVDVTVTW